MICLMSRAAAAEQLLGCLIIYRALLKVSGGNILSWKTELPLISAGAVFQAYHLMVHSVMAENRSAHPDPPSETFLNLHLSAT